MKIHKIIIGLFISAIVVSVLLMISINIDIKNSIYSDKELIVWDELDFGEHLPDFGQEYYADESIELVSRSLTLKYSEDIDYSKFESYMQECKDFGYTIGVYNHDNVYMACNENGYYLHLSYHEDVSKNTLWIRLEAPVNANQIEWPDKYFTENIPEPDILTGEVDSDESTYYSAFLTNFDKASFDKYVSECIDNGFDIIIQQNDYFYKARNKDKILVIIKYLGCDTISFYVSDTNK